MERGLKPHLPSAHLGTGSRPSPLGGDPSESSEQAGTSSRDHRQTSEALPARTTQTAATLPWLRADPQGLCAFRCFMLTPGLTHTRAQRGSPPSIRSTEEAAMQEEKPHSRGNTWELPETGPAWVVSLGLHSPGAAATSVCLVTRGHCPHLGVCEVWSSNPGMPSTPWPVCKLDHSAGPGMLVADLGLLGGGSGASRTSWIKSPQGRLPLGSKFLVRAARSSSIRRVRPCPVQSRCLWAFPSRDRGWS